MKKYILILSCLMVAMAAAVVSSCNKASTINIDDYQVVIGSAPGAVLASGEIEKYPTLRINIDGPESGARFNLSVTLPGELPITRIVYVGERNEVSLNFDSFAVDPHDVYEVLVSISSADSGAVLALEKVDVWFVEGN